MKKFVSLLLTAVIFATMIPLAVSSSAISAFAATIDSVQTADPTTQPETTAPATQPTTKAPTQPAITQPKPISVITPSAPKKFTVMETDVDKVIIKWTKVSNADYYVISRADENSKGKIGKYKVIKVIDDMTKIAYANTALITAGRVYKYKIVAKRERNNIITTSPEKTLKVMTKPYDVSKVKVSKNTYDKKLGNYITIKWKKSSVATNYVVQRSAEKANGKFGNYKTIKTTKKKTTQLRDNFLTYLYG